jgi:ankyrin repeat protein
VFQYGKTSLMEAATQDDDSIVKLLLGHGANVNLKDKNGWTALHLAALNDRASNIQLLLEGGTSQTETDNVSIVGSECSRIWQSMRRA